MKKLFIVASVSLGCAWVSSALALDPSIVSTARDLGEQGLRAYDEGRYDEAVSKLQQAYQAVKVPTLARDAARALTKQGRLVAAAELYLEATRLTPNELWHGPVQQQAQREADQEREALLPLIPRLKIILDGVTAHDTQVTLDNVVVPEALVGTEQFADPGKHQVVATHAARSEVQSIELRQGEHREVVLRFSPVQAGPIATQTVAPASGYTPAAHEHSDPSRGKRQRNLGWIGVGVGTAGIAFGTTTGIIALVMRSNLRSDGCIDYRCVDHPELRSRVNTYNTLLPLTTVGFVVGGVAAATGVTLLLTSPKQETEPNMSLTLGPGSLALRGGF